MHILLLQHNPTLGDSYGNTRQLADMARKAAALSPAPEGQRTLCIVPAYALAGVPWNEIQRISGFYTRCREAADELADLLADGPDLLVSFTGAEIPLYAFISGGRILSLARQPDGVIKIPGGPSLYLPETDPAWAHLEAQEMLASSKVSDVDAVLFNASEHFLPGAQEKREMHCAAMAQLWNLPVIYVQQYGATDSLVYSGQTFVIDAAGSMVGRAAAFEQAVLAVDMEGKDVKVTEVPLSGGEAEAIRPDPQGEEALFRAMVLGVRDYARKCGLKGIVLGLSGGMDSALAACIAVEALGPENVLAVLMPSRWSSGHSESDAEALAKNLGIATKTACITPMMDAFASVLDPLFADLPPVANDLTADNIQPRIRGTLLMAFANRLGYGVLGTGNKSEIAVGYCTLYGDTVAAIEPLGDIYKTEVYDVARWYNGMRGEEIIPENIFTKAPSAELHPDQVDEDSLPPYPVLDDILRRLIEGGANPETLVVPGVDDCVVRKVVRLLAISEFKRHQCAPNIKLSPVTFGCEWHLPAAAKAL